MKQIPKYIYFALAVALIFMWVDNMVTCWRDTWAWPVWIEQFGGWLTYIIWPTIVALWTMAVSYVVGCWTLKRIGVIQDSDYLLSTAIGLGVVAFATYVLGHAQVLYWWVFAPVGISIIYIGRVRLCTLLTLIRQGITGSGCWHWTEKLLGIVILYYIWRTFWAVFHPRTGWDECNSHLVLPKLYVENHAIQFHEWVNFSNFPPFLEMLMTIQRMFTPIGTALIPWLFHIGTLCVIWRLVRDVVYIPWISINPPMTVTPFLYRLPQLIAILIYLMLPITTLHSQAVLSDPVLVFYGSLLLLVWFTRPRRCNGEQILTNHVPVMGMLAGIVISIKYTGIILVALFLMDYIRTEMIHLLRYIAWEREGGAIKGATLNTIRFRSKWFFGFLILPMLIFCSPWMLNNIILFGNPIFPTADFLIPESWGTVAPSIQAQLSINYWQMLEFFKVDWLDWQELLTLRDPAPWITGRARPDELSPWLIVLMPLVLWQWKRFTTAGKWAIGIALTYVAVWLVVIGMLHTRYMLPAYPILAAACGVAVVNLLTKKETLKIGDDHGWGPYQIIKSGKWKDLPRHMFNRHSDTEGRDEHQ